MTHLASAFRFASALWLLFVSAPAAAQDSLRVPSQVLLKRVAEAVDGNRHGGDIYIVSRHDSLSPIAGVFRERRAAEESARRMGRAHVVLGPYRYQAIGPALHLPEPDPVFGCVHDRLTSMLGICPQLLMNWEAVESLSLTVRMRDGTTRTMDLGRSSDAVFLSIPAIDKFVIPYYERIIGVNAAAEMRQGIVAQVTRPREP